MDRDRKGYVAGRGREDSVLAPAVKRERSSPPPPDRPAKMYRPDSKLSIMLGSTAIPQNQFNVIQKKLSDQEKIIAARGAEIKERCTQIHDLKQELEVKASRDRRILVKKSDQQLLTKYDKTRNDNHDLQGRLDRASDENRNLRDRLDKSRDWNQELQDKLDRAKGENRNLIVELGDLDKRRTSNKGDQYVPRDRQLEEAMNKVTDLRGEIRILERQYEDANDKLENQEDLLNAGRKCLTAKNEECERLGEENKQLRATVSERDSTISSVYDQVMRSAMASGDEMTQMALQAQAERTLSMVKGLQKDVAERDTEIKGYIAENKKLMDANSTLKPLNEELTAELGDLKTKNRELAAKQDESIKAKVATEERATESKAVLEEQKHLIDRLMKENARLLEAKPNAK